MSKKDYQALARALYAARLIVECPPPNVVYHVSDGLVALGHAVDRIADALDEDNPRFDRQRFLEACETGTTKGMPGNPRKMNTAARMNLSGR